MRSLIRTLQRRIEAEGTLRGHNLVAFSGGVDSSVVAALVHEVFPSNSLACLGVSPSLPAAQRELAHTIADRIGIGLREVVTQEGSDPEYIANRGQSCYHCKSHLYSALEAIAADATAAVHSRNGGDGDSRNVLFNGTNQEDRSDTTRVGLKAAAEYSVSSPIDTLTKAQVRAVARALALPNWDHAASPCLRSRLAFGVAATPASLARVERAEAAARALLALGPRDNLRVRAMAAERALVEVDAARLDAARARAAVLSAAILPLGFAALDVRAFRSGAVSGHADAAAAVAATAASAEASVEERVAADGTRVSAVRAARSQ
ncbi:hypothetical protein JKP88DRAFT_176058 [Tribonema minus]|uniref:Asparagine synthetase domain-containing protein n=1 Tax=Tribonema minus TaxID=303371 RepID=A0A836CNR6_9STRA|nr:hypothetical protein JKP88DRAFT_176058 [Tribonema minus]